MGVRKYLRQSPESYRLLLAEREHSSPLTRIFASEFFQRLVIVPE